MADAVFRAHKHVLLSLAEKAATVVSSRDTREELAALRVAVSPALIEFTGTDLELMVINTSVSVTTEDTKVLYFPAVRLLSLLKEAPDGPVQFSVTGKVATIDAGKAQWTMTLADGGGYPPMPDLTGVEYSSVKREDLLAGLKAVRYAVGHDGARPGYMIVNVTDGQMTAADGGRFQRVPVEGCPDVQIPCAGSPAAADLLAKLLGQSELAETEVGSTDRSLVFRTGHVTLTVQHFQARFADVERMLLRPAMENTLDLTVSKDALLDAVRRVRVAADPDTHAIALSLTQGQVAVQAKDKWGNAATEAVSAGWEHPDRVVVVNHKFLTEAIGGYPRAMLRFKLGPETARKKSLVLLADDESGFTAVLSQMLRSMLGF